MEFEYGYRSWVVWKLWEYGSLVLGLESLDIWFRTLYLVYGLGVGTPKLISCWFELRRVLRILDACIRKGIAAS